MKGYQWVSFESMAVFYHTLCYLVKGLSQHLYCLSHTAVFIRHLRVINFIKNISGMLI